LTVYRANMPPPDVKGKVVILVDDGIATGSTMIAAARGVWSLKPGSITIAVPVGPKETIRRLRDEAEMIICPYTPEPFNAVGQFYEDFHEMSDREVLDILKEFR
jgi:putative phosphoribosyl transferase